MAANQAEVDLVVSAAGALPDLERQLSQIVRQAENSAPEVDVQASLAVQNSIAVMSTQLDQALRAVDATDPSIDVSAALDAQESLRNLRNDLDELTRAARSGGTDIIDLEAQLDFPRSLAEVTAAINDLVTDAERAAPDIDLEVDVDDEGVTRLTRAVRRLGDGSRVAGRGVGQLVGGVAALSLGVGGAVNTVAALVATLQQVAPAAAVGTSALLTQKLALGTLKLALVGVEDAIKGVFDESLTADEFHESIKGLAPEARLFVDELHTMRRELRAVQQQVQNRVFRGFDDELRSLAKTLGPIVTPALNRTADSLNVMGREAATAARQLGQQGVLGQALQGATTALQTLEEVPARAARSFGFLAAASTPALNRIALAVDDVSLKISQKLQRAFESGALEDSIDQAVSALAQFGTVLGNFGAGVSNIFSGLTQNGGGLFDTLEKISEAFERLTASREFQTILNELSLTAGVLVENVLPLIQEAFVQLGPVIEELAPVVRDFVAAIGPELIPIIQQLGPILVDIALILRDQLPLAIELASAAIGALGVALDIVKVGMDLAKEASAFFADLLESDFAKAMGAASDAAVENSDEIQSAFISWTAEAGRLVSGFQDTLSDFSSDVRETLVGGFVSAFNDTLEAIRTFVGSFIGALVDLPGRARQIGVDIMSGLAGGLTAGITRVLGIANDIANRITSTIKGALESRSPSKVMIRVGEDVDRGLAIGMRNKISLVERTAKEVADKMRLVIPERTAAAFDRTNLPTFTGRGTSVIQVYIGNQLVKQIINDEFRSVLNRRDRTFAQGVRI